MGDDKNKTTLTIVQDFPKKKTDNHGGVEMVQQEKFKMDNKNKSTTLTIVQDFPKKKAESSHTGVEMVQGKDVNMN